MGGLIPLTKPCLTGKELKYIRRAVVDSGIGENGLFFRKCCRLLEKQYAVPRVLLTPSCTAALEMAAHLCALRPGDEVILPSFTFPSTANAFLLLGARPVFVDIRPDTLNLDETRLESAVTPRTRVIVPVHYAGVACDMDGIAEVARRHRLRIVEDAAQGLNSFYEGRPLGTLGDLGAFSFHATKNCTCGEGGALCLNSAELIEHAEIIRNKGTDRARFLRGEVDKYSWVGLGSSHLPSEIACAFLYAQLREVVRITENRRQAHEYYLRHLRPLEGAGLLRLPRTPDGCVSNCHIFYVLLPDRDTRDGLMNHLRHRGIRASFHYVPLHASPMGRQLGYREGELPVTERLSACLLRLPLYATITRLEQQRVVRQLRTFFALGPGELEDPSPRVAA
jgi:dTDP-4-amino-4,6-dideoxygalactose transaminase